MSYFRTIFVRSVLICFWKRKKNAHIILHVHIGVWYKNAVCCQLVFLSGPMHSWCLWESICVRDRKLWSCHPPWPHKRFQGRRPKFQSNVTSPHTAVWFLGAGLPLSYTWSERLAEETSTREIWWDCGADSYEDLSRRWWFYNQWVWLIFLQQWTDNIVSFSI